VGKLEEERSLDLGTDETEMLKLFLRNYGEMCGMD
jgi:hypothetical protein